MSCVRGNKYSLPDFPTAPGNGTLCPCLAWAWSAGRCSSDRDTTWAASRSEPCPRTLCRRWRTPTRRRRSPPLARQRGARSSPGNPGRCCCRPSCRNRVHRYDDYSTWFTSWITADVPPWSRVSVAAVQTLFGDRWLLNPDNRWTTGHRVPIFVCMRRCNDRNSAN